MPGKKSLNNVAKALNKGVVQVNGHMDKKNRSSPSKRTPSPAVTVERTVNNNETTLRSPLQNRKEWSTLPKAMNECVRTDDKLTVKQPRDARDRSASPAAKSELLPQNGQITALSPTLKRKDVTLCLPQENGTSPTDIVSMCSQPKVKGLQNLGNTCFFNSVMQNLCQTPALVCLLSEQCEPKRKRRFLPIGSSNIAKEIEPLDTVLEEADDLTEALNNFFDEMATSQQATIRPANLFSQVCRKAAQFRGFRQQDSHELLRHLIEGVYNEESKRQKAAVLVGLGMSTKVDPKTVPPETKSYVQAYKPDAQHTILDVVFGGLLLNTILCDECKKASQRIEPFMDLSLSITEARPQRPTVGGKKITKSMQKKLERKKRKEANHRRRMALKASKAQNGQDVGSDGGPEGENDDADSCAASNDDDADGSDGDVEDNEDSGGKMDALIKNIDDLDLNIACRGSGSSDNDDGDHNDDDEDIDDDDGVVLDEQTRRSMRQWIEKSLATLGSPDAKASQGGCSLYSCLSHYTSPELLTGINKFRCDNCSKKRGERGKGGKLEPVYTNAQMRALILLPPAVLTLHLKRFQQTDSGLRKVSKTVTFPQILDLAPYCSKACLNITPNQTRVLYALYGIVEHHGSLQGGHYTAFVKTRNRDAEKISKFLNRHPVRMNLKDLIAISNRLRLESESNADDACVADENSCGAPVESGGKWYHVSDSCVRPSSESAALNAEAYILFYERIL